MINGINHITIAVGNIDSSLDFYMNQLGFAGHVKWQMGAYLSIGDLWFCLCLDTPDIKTDYTHIAFDVGDSDFKNICTKLLSNNIPQWKPIKVRVNRSTF